MCLLWQFLKGYAVLLSTQSNKQNHEKSLICHHSLGNSFVGKSANRAGNDHAYPRLGMTFSKFTGDRLLSVSDDRSLGTKYKAGFVAGLEVQRQVSDRVAASIGALYSEQGTKFEHDENVGVNTTVKANYIAMPVLGIYTSATGLSLKLGLQPEVRVSDDANYVLNRVALSLPVGLSYEFHHVALDVRYNIGLTHVYKHSVTGLSSRNSTFMLTLGYGIEL